MSIHDLYDKERQYEYDAFGDYGKIETLSFPSFLIFLEQYINKAKAAYSGKWDKKLPPWLKTCAEFEKHGTAPVKAYEEIIKVMALAGAALETYTSFDASKWRENSEEDASKWQD